MNDPILIIVTFTIVAVIMIVCVLNILQYRKSKKLHKMLEKLEIEKNVIDSSPIIPELTKVESILKNEKLEIMYNDWKNRLDVIKGKQIPKIADMLIDAEYSLDEQDYKSTMYKIAKLEMEIYKVRTNSDFLLNEIKEITSSEEKNRSLIAQLKGNYRNLFQNFNDKQASFGIAKNAMKLQFETIKKRFVDFEDAMDNNDYTEVPIIIKSIEDLLEHMKVLMEEVPNIIILACTILPKKIEELEKMYNQMIDEKYPLGYLNVEYNIEEAKKKIADVLSRLKILNIEDSLFEFKVLSEYFEQTFKDLEKEKQNKKEYLDDNKVFERKLSSINHVVNQIFSKLDEVKRAYNLNEDDLKYINDVYKELNKLNNDYKVLKLHVSNNTFAYSKLIKETQGFTTRLNIIQEHLDESLETIGSMQSDEARARQQLDEIRSILKESKNIIRIYNFMVIPNYYYVQLDEANSAIKEIVKELSKKPISIETLNTRVDTARDLTLKLYNTSKELVKISKLAETAIVYGNRFRPIDSDIDRNLAMAELCFRKGDYRKSLDISVNSLNKIEPNIYNKLLKNYNKM